MAFAELSAAWLREQQTRVQVGELSPRTLEIYEVGLRLHVLGALRLRAITPHQLVAWIRSLRAAGYAPDSVVGFWRPLHLVLGHAVRHGVIAGNPADRLTASERPSPGPSRKRFLTRGEMRRLPQAAPAGYRTAIASGLFSGLRLSELLALTWRDIDLDDGVLRVRDQLDRHGHHAPGTPAARRDVILIPARASSTGCERWRDSAPKATLSSALPPATPWATATSRAAASPRPRSAPGSRASRSTRCATRSRASS
jgi:integrase